MLSCCIPTRQESNAKPLAACREALAHILPIAAAKIDDAVAEARSVLQLIGKLPPCRGVHLDRDIGVEPFELRDLLLRRKRGHQAILEGAQHAARREVMWTLAALRRWCRAVRAPRKHRPCSPPAQELCSARSVTDTPLKRGSG